MTQPQPELMCAFHAWRARLLASLATLPPNALRALAAELRITAGCVDQELREREQGAAERADARLFKQRGEP